MLTRIPNRRIRDNEYEFPADREVSKPVQELIQAILTPGAFASVKTISRPVSSSDQNGSVPSAR